MQLVHPQATLSAFASNCVQLPLSAFAHPTKYLRVGKPETPTPHDQGAPELLVEAL